MKPRSRARRPIGRARCLLMILGLAILPACNTFKGLGQDVQNAAESTEKAIDRATD